MRDFVGERQGNRSCVGGENDGKRTFVRRGFSMYVSGCCVICRISNKFPSVEKFHRWMWAADECFFSFIFSDDAKPHRTKPNAAYYTRIPLFRGNLQKMLEMGCPWMDRIRRVVIATNVPYCEFWCNSSTTVLDDCSNNGPRR